MTSNEIFHRQRKDAFDGIISLIEKRLAAIGTIPVSRFDEISLESLRQSSEKESWRLVLQGMQYLKDGAPGGKPGSVAAAMSLASLRSGAFAAAIGVRPPQFEQLPFSADYTPGQEEALFFARRLIEAAEADLAESRKIICKRMSQEDPESGIGIPKEQMVFLFNILAEAYGRVCRDFAAMLDGIKPAPERRS